MSTTESTTTNALDADSAIDLIDEKASLKLIADQMGITYSNNITVEKLKEKIQEKRDAINNASASTASTETSGASGTQVNPLASPNAEELPEKPLTLRQYLQQEQMKLVRCRITCMDPKKADLTGEIFTVANEFLGTVRKFVPFGEITDNGYHIPYCIYQMMLGREFLQIRTVKKSGGRQETKTAYVREFSIDVLPDLTKAELTALGNMQASRGDVD